MVRGGQNAKPLALHALEGTGRPTRMKPDPPRGDVLTDLTPPAVLDSYGKQCWRRNAPVLAGMGLLTAADVDELTMYCDAYASWRRASIVARRIKPDADDYRRVQLTVEKSRDQVRYLAGELGMSPASRSRLSVGKPTEDADPMEALIGRQRAS